MKKVIKKLVLSLLIYMLVVYQIPNNSYATDLYDIYIDTSQIEKVHKKNIPSEGEIWQYFERKLDKNAFDQLKKLITNVHFNITSIDHLIKLNAEDYILANGFPYMAQGSYKVKLPADFGQEPTISEKITLSNKVIKVLKYNDNKVWLFARGSFMRHGFGYEEYSLINAINPDKSLILGSVDYVSEERGADDIKATPWKQIPLEVRNRIDDIGEFIGHNVIGDCVNLFVLKSNLKTKKERLTKVVACHEKDNFKVKEEIILEK